MSDVMEVDDRDGLRVLRLNRPERKNALDGRLIRAITDEVRAAAGDDAVRAIALTGNGTAFCSGLDLGAGGADAADTTDDGAPPASDQGSTGYEAADNMAMVMRVECEKPIVAGINGAAVGMGVALAMAADIRIAGPAARFHPGDARVGTSPDGGATWTVTEALGHEGAMRFFLEQRAVPAEEALRIGLVGEVTDSDEALEARLVEYGTMLASVAPLAARQTKRLVGRVSRPTDLAAHLDEEVRLALVGLASKDGARAIEALLTGRPARFTGE